MTNLTKLLSAAALCAVVTMPVMLTTAADARVVVGIGINLTPPPARYEVRPARPWGNGVWIDGHWDRRDGQWVWVGGRWDRPMNGRTRWIPGHYTPNGRWVEGRWI